MPKLDTPKQMAEDAAQLATADTEVLVATEVLNAADIIAKAAWYALKAAKAKTVQDADTAQRTLDAANAAVLAASNASRSAIAAYNALYAAIKTRRAAKYAEMCKAERDQRDAICLAKQAADRAAAESNREADLVVARSKVAERKEYKTFIQSDDYTKYDPYYAATCTTAIYQ